VYREVGTISGVARVKHLTRKQYGGSRLTQKISKAFVQGKLRDSARRIQVALARNGNHADPKTILNTMKRQGVCHFTTAGRVKPWKQ
jgi:hypothetical protein